MKRFSTQRGLRIVARFSLYAAAAFVVGAACEATRGATATAPLDLVSNQVILDWNVIAYDALMAQDEYANPLVATRVFSMMHAAQHDAINAIDPIYSTYALEGAGSVDAAGADPVAAAATAAHGVLSALLPDQSATLNEKLAETLARVSPAAAARAAAVGQAAAQAVLEDREADGSDAPPVGDYVPAAGPGKYQPTPPFGFAFAPGWTSVKPFALTEAEQFRSPPPPALEGATYAAAFNEVRTVGAAVSDSRTADQTSYARFWYEFSDIGWNRVGRIVAAERKLGLQSTARLFALLNMAMADAYIAGWDSKYHYDLWRPYTAIREAATDGNDGTAPEADWEPLMPTPPVQDYPSTHSALGDAAAAVLASVFGDNVSFTFPSTSAEPALSSRSFTSFSQAADENADSRVMAGLHFRFACEAGQELGRRVGHWVIENRLQPRS